MDHRQDPKDTCIEFLEHSKHLLSIWSIRFSPSSFSTAVLPNSACSYTVQFTNYLSSTCPLGQKPLLRGRSRRQGGGGDPNFRIKGAQELRMTTNIHVHKACTFCAWLQVNA